MQKLILSLFPGADLLGLGFQQEMPDACIVRVEPVEQGGAAMSDGSSEGERQIERSRIMLRARIEELETERDHWRSEHDRIVGAFEQDHHEQCSKRRQAERERDDLRRQLAEARQLLRGVLRIIEWEKGVCPECRSVPVLGHKPRCRLAAFLAGEERRCDS